MKQDIELTLIDGLPISVCIDDLVTYTSKLGCTELIGKLTGTFLVKETYNTVRGKIEEARTNDVELAYDITQGIYSHLIPLSTIAELIIKDDNPDDVILLFKDNTRIHTRYSLEQLKERTKRIAFPK